MEKLVAEFDHISRNIIGLCTALATLLELTENSNKKIVVEIREK